LHCEVAFLRMPIEDNIQDLVNLMFKIAQTTIDFQPESGPVLKDRLSKLNELMIQIDEQSDALTEKIPISSLDRFDQLTKHKRWSQPAGS
jgi:hypothetical protein